MLDHDKVSSKDLSFGFLDALPAFMHDMMLTDINEHSLKHLGDITGGAEPKFWPVPVPILSSRRPKTSEAPIIKIWFLVDSGSNCTFLDEKTMSALTGSDSIPSSLYVSIQDPESVIECDLSHSHFWEANILGMAAMRKMNLSITDMNWAAETWRLARQ